MQTDAIADGALLADSRILVVEDEMVVAMALDDLLGDLGCEAMLAGTVAKALQLVATGEIDGAILDINIAGVMVYPVADELRKLGIPFIFSSAYGKRGLAADYRDCAMLQKPFPKEELAPTLAEALRGGQKRNPA